MDKLDCKLNENSATGRRCLNENGRFANFDALGWRGIGNEIGKVFVGEIKFKQDCSHS